jgi:hypothetical protein
MRSTEQDISAAPRFSVPAVREIAARGRIEEWVQTYLTTKPWANHGLLRGLYKRELLFWWGPLKIELSRLRRYCGPEKDMTFREARKVWEARVGRIAASLTEPLAVPPLLVSPPEGTRPPWRELQLDVYDGAHRLEAFRRAGYDAAWCLAALGSEEDRATFAEEHGATVSR